MTFCTTIRDEQLMRSFIVTFYYERKEKYLKHLES